MSCGGSKHQNRSALRISEVAALTGVSTRACRDLFHALIRQAKSRGGGWNQDEVESWARNNLQAMADVVARRQLDLSPRPAPAPASTAPAPAPVPARAPAPVPGPVPAVAGSAAPLPPQSRESPDSGPQWSCDACGKPMDYETYSGLCRPCFYMNAKDEALDEGFSLSEAVDEATAQADDDMVRLDEAFTDDVYDDGRYDDSGYDGIDSLSSRYDSAQAFSRAYGGGGTRYGDDEDYDDYQAAQRAILGEDVGRQKASWWMNPAGYNSGSPGSRSGSTFGGGKIRTTPYVPRPDYAQQAKDSGKPVKVGYGWKDSASGDGYIYFPNGEKRWGIYGASGVLMRHVDDDGVERFFLAKRGAGLSGGAGTWAVPGGALDRDETPLDGAMREFREEIKVDTGDITVHGDFSDKFHEDWAYTTVAVDVSHQFTPPTKLDWETAETGWFTRDEIRDLPKHPGFDAAYEQILGLYDTDDRDGAA